MLHAHPYHEFSLISAGDIAYTSNTCMDHITDRCFIFSRAYQLHNPFIEQTKKYERYQIMFKQNLLTQFSPEHLALLSPLTAKSGIYRVDEKTYLRMQHIMEMLLHRFEHSPDSPHALFEYSLLTAELLLLAAESVSQSPQTDSAFSDSYIGSVTQYIKDHFNEELTTSGLAANFFISRTKLANDFKRQLGMTIGTFLMLTRIENAKLLLRQGYSVSNVAKLCGYPGTSHFIKTFKKCTLLTPLKFQQKVLGDAKE